MKQSDKIEEIKNLIHPLLNSQKIDLVDIELKGKSRTQILRIFIDINGGIFLDQCESLSREISDLLDTKDLISGSYRLEVSSPGLDRPLKTERDFQRNIGRKVKINHLTDGEEIKTTTGTIDQVDENMIVIEQNNHRFEIDISKILMAKILPAW